MNLKNIMWSLKKQADTQKVYCLFLFIWSTTIITSDWRHRSHNNGCLCLRIRGCWVKQGTVELSWGDENVPYFVLSDTKTQSPKVLKLYTLWCCRFYCIHILSHFLKKLLISMLICWYLPWWTENPLENTFQGTRLLSWK